MGQALLSTAPGNDLHRHLADEAHAMKLGSHSPGFREDMGAFAERRSPGLGGR